MKLNKSTVDSIPLTAAGQKIYRDSELMLGQNDDAYLNALNMWPENLILKWGFDWPEFYIKIGIDAVKTQSRPYEGINRWQDVTYEYLYYFSDSCCCLSSAGFKFFLSATLFHYLNRQDRNNTFMDYFVSRLDNK